MNNNIAIVWYHEPNSIASHAAIAVDNKPYGFLLFPTREPNNLQRSLEKRIKNNEGITVQYLSVSHEQKKKINKMIQQKYYPSITCMHAVSKILAATTDIQIPFPINLLPDTSLIYLDNLQKKGNKTLLDQNTYNWPEKNLYDIINRIVCAVSLGCLPVIASMYCNCNPFINLSLLILTSAILIFKTHLAMRSTIHAV